MCCEKPLGVVGILARDNLCVSRVVLWDISCDCNNERIVFEIRYFLEVFSSEDFDEVSGDGEYLVLDLKSLILTKLSRKEVYLRFTRTF